MEEGDVTLDSRYFNCERLHAKIPKLTCFARQFALVRGSRSFLFPECGSCSQGKVIAKEHQNVLGKEKEKSLMPDQAKSGSEASEGKAQMCKDCGEKPTISPRSPYCSFCMQKRAVAARQGKAQNQPKRKGKDPGPERALKEGKAFEARKPQGDIQPPGKRGMEPVSIDFRAYPQILEGVKKLAEEEIRPIGLQIIFILKSHLAAHKTV